MLCSSCCFAEIVCIDAIGDGEIVRVGRSHQGNGG